ncbi:nuclear autoantigen Sp-100-like [Phyllostomus hastatus]|uniref:nuclear autoantigen Sp-100-like n=1 Tax=Phyllostomus hastatus TaxID=9423 RepID=UPI001E684364|nr:nuclear autoantigen Sp-100-like [Phyllostomus hastatus]
MATKGSDLSTRMSAEDQDIYNSVKETAGKLFKRHKVEISNAIKTPFPFFEMLRDHEFITNEKYNEYQAKLMRIPVTAAVYDILNELQETFDLPLLRDLFSNTIMENYPDLRRSYTIFKREISNISNYLESDAEENEGRSGIQLSLEQGTDRNSYPNLPWSGPHSLNYTGTATSDIGLSNDMSEEEISVIVDTTTGNNDALESQQANEQIAQVSEPVGSKNHKEEYVDFHSEILPVTCGEMKGMLYKNKLEEGSTVKCIKTEDGNWFTPQEFEAAGNYKTFKKLEEHCALWWENPKTADGGI